MPNYVINQLSFEGDQSKIDALMQSVKSKHDDGEDYLFDFNKIIPMPESLNITSGGRVDMAMAYVNYQETMDSKGLETYLGHTWVKQAGIESISHRDWYSWANANWGTNNWGTKWNSSSVSSTDNMIEFQTAWSTPEPVLIELSKQHPEVTITIKYADEDIGANCGRFVLLNGKELEFEPGDVIFACEVWGYDPAEYDEAYYRDQQIDNVLEEDEDE